MDWPTAATIISIAVAVIGGFCTIWGGHRSKKTKPESDAKSGEAVRIEALEKRVDSHDKQIEMLLREIMEILKD